jgi:hypothetical protein
VRAKYKIELSPGVTGTLMVDISLSKMMQEKCETLLDISKEEQQNLIGQKMQEIIYLLGAEEA